MRRPGLQNRRRARQSNREGKILNSHQARALRPRMLLSGDGLAGARLMRKITSLDDKLNRDLPDVIEALIEEDRLIGGLIEDYDAKGERTVGAATSPAFVTPELQHRYLERPWPCLTNWLLMRCLSGETEIFLDRAAQAEGNVGRGLDLVMLDYIQAPMDFTSA